MIRRLVQTMLCSFFLALPALAQVAVPPTPESGAVSITIGTKSPAVVSSAIPFSTSVAPALRTGVNGSGSWASGTYTYDAAGNIKAIGSDTYVYDTANRLVRGTAGGAGNVQSYTYDSFGNRLSSTTTGAACVVACEENVSIDAATNRVKSPAQGGVATYDKAGNMTSIDQVHTYAWDATGMMTEQIDGSAKHDYLYTADGERIAMYDVPAQTWTWEVRDLGGKVLREYVSHDAGASLASANWQWTRDHVYRDGQLLSAVVQPLDPFGRPAGMAVSECFHLDHLGTPRLITNTAGIKIGSHSYYAFGAEQAPGASEVPLEAMKFTGHERDSLMGDLHEMDYMHARYRAIALGRFLSLDPQLGQQQQPQSWNRYAYVFNSPLRLVDKNGRWPTKTHEMILELAFPGLSVTERGALQMASFTADDLLSGGQARDNSFMHGMRAPWQSVAEAQQLAAQYYTTTIAEAIAANATGEGTSHFDALYKLGFALHLIGDLTSPSHRGFQVWRYRLHSIQSHIDNENRAPTKEELAMAVAMMRAAYAEVFGQEAGDAAAQADASQTAPASKKTPQLTIRSDADARCYDASCR